MKTQYLTAALCLSTVMAVCGQPVSPIAASKPEARETAYTIVERGANHNLWERTTYETSSSGERVARVHRYEELASGLNFWDATARRWKESKEEIEPYSGGAIFRNAQHKVIFANNLATAGAIDMETPDGKRLVSHVIGLAYFDKASGKSVLFAEVKDSVGTLIAPNQILYADAFETDGGAARISVRFTCAKSFFEQDIILETQLPVAPEAYGLDSASTVVQVWTEFVAPPEPVKTARMIRGKAGVVASDEHLDFGVMKMGRGKAFMAGEGGRGISVGKQWVALEGRHFLVEEVPLPEMTGKLATLPKLENTSRERVNDVKRVASDRLRLPLMARDKSTTNSVQVAKAELPVKGFVLDYITINGSLTNYVFKGDQTYYVSGAVNFYGPNCVVEGGAVVKYAKNVGAKLVFHEGVEFQTDFYRPAVFTAKDDSSVGEGIAGAGTLSGYYASTALEIHSDENIFVDHLRIAHASVGLQYVGQTEFTTNFVRHAQILNCSAGIQTGEDVWDLALDFKNGLLSNVGTALDGYLWYGKADHLTINNCGLLAGDWGYGAYTVQFTNCIFANVTNLTGGGYDVYVGGSHNGFYNAPAFGESQFSIGAWPFQTVGAGSYYLSSTNSFRNVGTTNIDANLLADLRILTTYPPIVYSNTIIAVDTTFNPQAQRDTDVPDLGYHYYPIDYAVNEVTIAGGVTLRLLGGVALAAFGNNGLVLVVQGARLLSKGSPAAMNYLVRYQAVQEQSQVWGANGTPKALVYYKDDDAPYGDPGGVFDFTHLSVLASSTDSKNLFANWGSFASLPLAIQNSYLAGGSLHHEDTWGDTLPLYLTNNVFERVALYIGEDGNYSTEVIMRNNLFRHGTLAISYEPNGRSWEIHDNAFDNSILSQSGSSFDNSHNGYINCGPWDDSSGGDVMVSSFSYALGPLGPFYQASTDFENQGSVTADAVRLYHFTTQTDQTKEEDSVVDIGFHYVAVNGSGNPMDSDGDGTPDYIEDANGNGQSLTVTLIAPAHNSSYSEPATIPIHATVWDWRSPATNVSFFSGSLQISQGITNAPYTYSWPAVAAGTYSLSATARDLAGAIATSASITVNVTNLCGN